MTNERTIEPTARDLATVDEVPPARVRAALAARGGPVMGRRLVRAAGAVCVYALYLAGGVVLYELLRFGWTQ